MCCERCKKQNLPLCCCHHTFTLQKGPTFNCFTGAAQFAVSSEHGCIGQFPGLSIGKFIQGVPVHISLSFLTNRIITDKGQCEVAI